MPRVRPGEAGIGLQAFAERLEIIEAELLRDLEHRGLVLLHFFQADLVNLVSGKFGRCLVMNQELVILSPSGSDEMPGSARPAGM